MFKQIICTIIVLIGICTYLFKNEEELSGNFNTEDPQYFDGKKDGEIKNLNVIKWIINKNYRRGYFWSSHEKI